MRIQYCSDLHLEFPDNKQFIEMNPLVPIGDILILAGDIIPFQYMDAAKSFFKFCSENFGETYWIAGNHEYYHSDLTGRTAELMEEIVDRVFLVNNFAIDREDARLILSTLWTRISPEKSFSISTALNDYRLIRDNNVPFSVDRCNELFDENLNFIKGAIEKSNQKRNIVVTHHVPSYKNYPQEYLNSVINEAFATNLDDFIETANIDTWIYGHHHRNIPAFEINDTRLLTNQLGYIKYAENKGFRLDALV